MYLRIESDTLNKAGMTHCPNLSLPGPIEKDKAFYTGSSVDGNCRIYNFRPKCCMQYECAWLQGYGNDDDRPDKSLILFDTLHHITNSAEAKPLEDGREKTEEGKAVINRMSISMGKPIIVLNFYERRIQRVVGRPIKKE